jgi:hypothetical protein
VHARNWVAAAPASWLPYLLAISAVCVTGRTQCTEKTSAQMWANPSVQTNAVTLYKIVPVVLCCPGSWSETQSYNTLALTASVIGLIAFHAASWASRHEVKGLCYMWRSAAVNLSSSCAGGARGECVIMICPGRAPSTTTETPRSALQAASPRLGRT